MVVDEHGQFVGNVAAGTQVVVPVSPGRHVFYSWSDRDLRSDKVPTFNPVAATRVDALGADPQYVALLVETRGSVVSRCFPYAFVSMHNVLPGDEMRSELHEWLWSTDVLVPNRQAGQQALNANSGLLQAHLELGRAKLGLLDELSARPAPVEARPRGSE